MDVQNTPPVFTGSLSASLSEDAPVGTVALVIKARDADRAQPRDVKLELITSMYIFFLLCVLSMYIFLRRLKPAISQIFSEVADFKTTLSTTFQLL